MGKKNTTLTLNIYQELINDIQTIHGRARRALAEAYWEIGRRIVEVEQDGDIRAQYGAMLIKSISADLTKAHGSGFSLANLKRMKQFYLVHRKKGSAPSQLSWTLCIELLNVKDDKEREALQRRVIKEKITARALRAIIKAQNEGRTLTVKNPQKSIYQLPLRRPKKLQLYTYKQVINPDIVVPRGEVLLDCGLFVYRSVKKSKGITIVEKPDYTYAAIVERVVDGDTVILLIDLGFDTIVRERIRLRGVDTPEFVTPEGAAAKVFVSQHLQKGQTCVVKTYRNDMYGRFIGDIFCKDIGSTPPEIINEGLHLNAELLRVGYAKPMS